MKIFLSIHVILWIILEIFILYFLCAFTTFDNAINEFPLSYWLFYSQLYVLPFSSFLFLLVYFIKSTIQIQISRRKK